MEPNFPFSPHCLGPACPACSCLVCARAEADDSLGEPPPMQRELRYVMDASGTLSRALVLPLKYIKLLGKPFCIWTLKTSFFFLAAVFCVTAFVVQRCLVFSNIPTLKSGN